MSQSEVKSILDIANIQKQRPTLGQEWSPLLAKLVEFWYWQRGEDVFIKANSSVALGASQTAFSWDVALIPSQPGGQFMGEEWDLICAWLVDENNKDPADSVLFALAGDAVFSYPLPLTVFRTGTGLTFGGVGRNYWSYPSFFDVQNPDGFMQNTIKLRKGRELVAYNTTTATAGNRSISTYAYLRRRQI
jgi:hypothetical protein